MGLLELITKKITRDKLNEFLKKYASEKKTLDIGCSNARHYKSLFPNSIGVDIMKSRNIDIQGDAHLLPIKSKSFDVILCTEVLEHLKEPKQAINEMKRILRLNGMLILTTRFIFPLHDIPTDYYRYTKYGLKHLLNDWIIIEIKEETDTIGCIAVLLQRIGFQCNILYFKPFKIVFHAIAHMIKHFGFIIPEDDIMTSGYYVIAIKRHTNAKRS